MSDRARCACRRCAIRGLMGPAVIITLGVLLLLGETRGDNFSIWNTYPVILIVMGIISLAAATSSAEGHISTAASPPGPAVPGAPARPQSPFPGQG
jgi:hypothetical protein